MPAFGWWAEVHDLAGAAEERVTRRRGSVPRRCTAIQLGDPDTVVALAAAGREHDSSAIGGHRVVGHHASRQRALLFAGAGIQRPTIRRSRSRANRFRIRLKHPVARCPAWSAALRILSEVSCRPPLASSTKCSPVGAPCWDEYLPSGVSAVPSCFVGANVICSASRSDIAGARREGPAGVRREIHPSPVARPGGGRALAV